MRSSRTRKNNEPILNFIKDWVIPIIIAFIAARLITKYVLFKVSIPSESMYPTLTKNDQLFVTRVYDYDKLKNGDMLVFNFHEDEDHKVLIKRAIGLPGDTVDIRSNGDVYVNGNKIDEPYINTEDTRNTKSGYFQVPEGKYFFLGDNRNRSNDSRYWNEPFIDKKDILGKARIRVYPFNRIKVFN